MDFISLDSNLHSFHPWGHQLTHSLTTISAVLVMQNMYRKYFYASGGLSYLELYKYHELLLKRDTALIDPMLLPLLSTESLNFISDGAQYTRVEKTLRIVDYEPVKRYLNVCVHDRESHENCSVCGKCCRTLMTLIQLVSLKSSLNYLILGNIRNMLNFCIFASKLYFKIKILLREIVLSWQKETGLSCRRFWSVMVWFHYLV